LHWLAEEAVKKRKASRIKLTQTNWSSVGEPAGTAAEALLANGRNKLQFSRRQYYEENFHVNYMGQMWDLLLLWRGLSY
jgi:hypothetical protein